MTAPDQTNAEVSDERLREPSAIVCCPACGGEGGVYEPEQRFSRWHLDPPGETFIPCEECHGTGMIEGKPETLTLDDLAERCGEHA